VLLPVCENGQHNKNAALESQKDLADSYSYFITAAKVQKKCEQRSFFREYFILLFFAFERMTADYH